MAAIKLERLPDRVPVKITICVTPELSRALAEYARAYEEAYGTSASVSDLAPAMIAAFLAGDRGFSRRLKGSKPPG